MSFNVTKVRADFPILTTKKNGKALVYLDSAATSLKPWPVIERIGHFYTYETANVHRGAHSLSDTATRFFEESRDKIAQFIGATAEETVFTKGTTESINMVAQSWGRANLQAGDEVITTEMEHHSMIVPWQMICEERKARLVVAPITDTGELDLEKFQKLLNPKVKMLAITHSSNTLGTINDIKAITSLARKVGAKVLVDGAQMVAGHKVNVKDLGVDFYAFSGHKMFGPFGIGILYGRKELLDQIPPYQGGGSMISQVTLAKTTYNETPFKFEAGTPHIEGAIGLAAAVDYINKLGIDNIQAHEDQLCAYAEAQLREIKGFQRVGNAKNRSPIISFNIEGLHSSDIAQILDQENVAVRAGHLCTQPLMERFKITGVVRASISIFNTESDIQALAKGLLKAKELLA